HDRAAAGSLYIIKNTIIANYGGSTTGNILNLASSTSYSVRFDGTRARDVVASLFTNAGVMGYFGPLTAGDLDGNGRDDLVIAEDGSKNGRVSSGSTYVLYDSLVNSFTGAGNIVDLATSTNWNLRYDGAVAGDRHTNGGKIRIADLDNDGKNDLIMGATGDPTQNETNAGKTYVVFNTLLDDDAASMTGNVIDLASSTNWNIRYDGAASGDWLDASALQLVDVNHDGQNDVVLGAWGADNGGNGTGSLYVIYYFPAAISLDPVFQDTSGNAFAVTGSVSAPNNPTTIAAVEWSPTGSPGGSDWTDCSASDGAFDSNSEAFSCAIPAASFTRTLYFRPEDSKSIYIASSSYAHAVFTVASPI
ncbi:MAG: hypothetical protein ACREO5_13345, partial [Candidatus Binatia bacterium]